MKRLIDDDSEWVLMIEVSASSTLLEPPSSVVIHDRFLDAVLGASWLGNPSGGLLTLKCMFGRDLKMSVGSSNRRLGNPL